MIAAALALAAALLWGSSGFAAGALSREAGALRVGALAQSAGLVVLMLLAVARGGTLEFDVLLRGAAAGAMGAVGLVLLYRALATGRAGVVAPIASSGVLLPALVGLARGEHVTGVLGIGGALLLGGLVLVLRPGEHERTETRAEHRTSTNRDALWAFGAACCFGVFYLGIAADSGAQAQAATLGARVGGAATLIALLAAGRGRSAAGHLSPRQVGAAIAVGATDCVGNLAYSSATATGGLAVISLLAATYPVVTVVLARVRFRERVPPARAAGILAAVAGAALVGASA